MRDDDLQYQYVGGQQRPGFPALIEDFERRSAEAVERHACTLDLRYGPGPRETFDFFEAQGEPRGLLAYFHAGYWQSRDKSGFRWLAPAFTRRGLHVALVNYPLCPSVTLRELVDTVLSSAAPLRAHASPSPSRKGPDGLPFIACGHSAGGHLAAELGLAGHADGVIALSGIYDLEPLVATTLNERLRLDRSEARALSPLHRSRTGAPPALFIVGGDETPAFLEQNRRMHAAWRAAGNDAEAHVEPQADHFSLLRAFAAPQGALAERVNTLIGKAARRAAPAG